MRILIAGLGKSGTTAVFYAVKQRLHADAAFFFEKPPGGALPAGPVLAKLLTNQMDLAAWGSLPPFDRTVFMARDPRDVLVSRTLYRIVGSREPLPEGPLAEYFEILRRKEADPGACSLLEIIATLGRVLREDPLPLFLADFLQSVEVRRRFLPDAFLLRYEDFVAGNVAGASAYLGFDLPANVEVAAEHKRVERTRGSGDWRHWLTDRDVAFFRESLSEPMRFFAYPDDWVLAAEPSIPSRHATAYVGRLVEEQRRRVTTVRE